MISARKNKEVSLVTIIEKLTLEVNNMKKEISDLKEIVNIQTDIIENLVNNISNNDTLGASFSQRRALLDESARGDNTRTSFSITDLFSKDSPRASSTCEGSPRADSSTKNTPSKVIAPLEQHELASNSSKNSVHVELRKNTNKQSQKYPVRQKGYLKSTHSSRKDSKNISNKRIY